MMNDERIIKYLENEFSAEERLAFEIDIKNSPELKAEFEKYSRVKAETDDLKSAKLNSHYLNSIGPDFRKKLETRRSISTRRNLSYAFGVMLVFIFSIGILNNFLDKGSGLTELEEFTQSLNENQKIELLEAISSESEDYKMVSENISEDEFSDILETDIELSSEVAEAYNIGYNELLVGLNQQKVDKIYTEILNRNF